MFRAAAYGVPPRPSAVVAHRLDLDRVAGISASATGLRRSESATTARVPVSSKARRAKVLASGFVGLGLAAKIALGATAAAAVGITGAGVAGAAGVLPPAAQHAFDEFTGNDIAGFAGDDDEAVDVTEHPGRNTSETGVEKSEFGQETAEDARLRRSDRPGESPRGEAPGGVTPGDSGERNSTGKEAAEEAAENADNNVPVRGDSGEQRD